VPVQVAREGAIVAGLIVRPVAWRALVPAARRQRLALFRIKEAAALDDYIRRYEDAAPNNGKSP
jgi:hypothetical protein